MTDEIFTTKEKETENDPKNFRLPRGGLIACDRSGSGVGGFDIVWGKRQPAPTYTSAFVRKKRGFRRRGRANDGEQPAGSFVGMGGMATNASTKRNLHTLLFMSIRRRARDEHWILRDPQRRLGSARHPSNPC